MNFSEEQLQKIQEGKNEFAQSQDPPIVPCTNAKCYFKGCACGTKCGCHIKAADLPTAGADGGEPEMIQCDPCLDFAKQKRAEMAAAKAAADAQN
eukprot:CAMPEP_0172445772 /NCGR_PEP_ID=MMETSP1065-20121228/5561_1 /TAXON_ID=265537 /ORGANISM="Amphiprora paludosa, Strain CCMP125" /LENGTH=94 /DNA_ID=CAMNT_0013196741 /DNA_START=40 /DNA_END=324 /DNA_ORIENTATION=-